MTWKYHIETKLLRPIRRLRPQLYARRLGRYLEQSTRKIKVLSVWSNSIETDKTWAFVVTLPVDDWGDFGAVAVRETFKTQENELDVVDARHYIEIVILSTLVLNRFDVRKVEFCWGNPVSGIRVQVDVARPQWYRPVW